MERMKLFWIYSFIFLAAPYSLPDHIRYIYGKDEALSRQNIVDTCLYLFVVLCVIINITTKYHKTAKILAISIISSVLIFAVRYGNNISHLFGLIVWLGLMFFCWKVDAYKKKSITRKSISTVKL